MKPYKYLFLPALLLLNACMLGNDDDESDTIRLAEGTQTQQTLYADQTCTERCIRFYAVGYWNIRVTSPGTDDGSCDWLTPDLTQGEAGNHELGLTLQPNTTGEPRTAEIIIECNGNTVCITVEQSPSSASGDTVRFCVSTERMKIDATEGSGFIYLTAHTTDARGTEEALEWTIEPTESYDEKQLSVSPQSGKGDTMLQVATDSEASFEIVSGELRLPITAYTVDFSPRIEFADEHFKKELLGYDRDHDGELSEFEVSRIEELSVDATEIYSIAEIRYLKNLRILTLRTSSNRTGKISELDLRANKLLEEVYAENCNLNSLDVSGCDRLRILHCDNNVLTMLDLTGCTALTQLHCSANKLVRISGLPDCTALEEFQCRENDLEELDLSMMDNLHRLECDSNPKLYALTLSDTKRMAYLTVGNTGLSRMDLSGQRDLAWFKFGGCEFVSLDLSECTSLYEINSYYGGGSHNTSIIQLNLSGCTSLRNCMLGHILKIGALWSLDLTGCTALRTLNIDYQHIREVDLSDCTALEEFNCEVYRMGYSADNREPRIEKIDVSHNPKLRILDIGGAEYVTELDASCNPELEKLVCRGTGLTTLDLRHNPKLQEVDAQANSLTRILLLPKQAIEQLAYDENRTRIERIAL